MTILPIADEGFSQIPIIDISPLIAKNSDSRANIQRDRQTIATQIRRACREYGFFYIIGHGVDEGLQQRLEQLSRQFFALDLEKKLEISMTIGGRAWRGYFPVGGELTSGKPDLKEDIYFGAELEENHPLVKAGTPMHGRNLFPSYVPQLRETVLEYMAAMTQLGHAIAAGISLSLGLEESYFADRYTADPLILFRIFNYPPISGSFVCNIGDMLDCITRGLYRSTSHRVQNQSRRDRLSFPFFFDPNFNVEVKAIELDRVAVNDDKNERWDRASVHDFRGTYGDYVLSKVSKVFPQLRRSVM